MSDVKYIKQPYPWYTIGFIQSYWMTMRPYLMYVSGITGILGLSLNNLSPSLTLLYGFVFFFSYGFGQALTDCFQLDTDAISSPYRPLVRKIIKKREVLIVSLVFLLASGCVLTYANLWNSFLAATGIIGLGTYTFFKRKWWGGPFYNAWIVALLGLMGFMCGDASPGEAWNNQYLPGYLITIFFGYANFVLIGYFKDVEADSKTGYLTFPVVFGRKLSSYLSILFAILTLIAPIHFVLQNPHWQTTALLIAGSSFLLLAQYQTFQVKKDDDAYRPIANVVHSYLLILSSLICYQKPSWFLFIAAFYVLFAITLKMRPLRQQI